ncbi:glycoside hydrolase family 66 protein [Luedemannella helvata]|uniref:Dextranase n=1 Tax=Luedemannella helvata TaxID=349315 RepID=A0ABP4W062_9ACTN
MLLPTKACYAPGEPVAIELPAAPAARAIEVERLGVRVATVTVPAGADHVDLGPLPVGGYGVRLRDGAGHTAVEVLADPFARLRYGFVASYAPGRDIDGVLRLARRLHLTAVQFYDWAYRHADLVGPDEYADPLGQPVSLATVRALAAGLASVGTAPIGYAAVYGVGKDEWPAWEHAALLRADGTVHDLAGFLSIVDPADPAWLAHFRADLRKAVERVGLAGFHLDQYGFPRRAVRPDGRVVDLAEAFHTMICEVREELPDARLIFNNVNDFPVWRTTRSPQDATYTEVWEPHEALDDVAAVAVRARTLAPSRPAVLAAYQTVFDRLPAADAELTTKLTMATLFSHGATQLLAGEDGHVLVDPYYVRNHPAAPSTVDMLADWYDLLVAAGDVLFDPGNADITRSVVGGLNGEIDVEAPEEVWRRVVATPHGTVVHLINLVGQADLGWDTAKAHVTPVDRLTVRFRRVGAATPTVRVADPDRGPFFVDVPARVDGEYVIADLPTLGVWQIVLLGDS